MKLLLIRIKPNPAGKDRPPHGSPSAAQLAAEWVDFRNDAGVSVGLDEVGLWHLAYSPNHNPEWRRVMGFTGTLTAGQVVRVHSGLKRDVSVIRHEDLVGADHHVFSGEDAYVWNNKQGDSPLLFDEKARQTIDKASYAPNPPEGMVLVRQGEQLVPAFSRAASW